MDDQGEVVALVRSRWQDRAKPEQMKFEGAPSFSTTVRLTA